MSRQDIQKAVLNELRRSAHPISVRELVEQVRKRLPEFKQVSDFEFRSAVVAMTAGGILESTPTNEVAASAAPTLSARG